MELLSINLAANETRQFVKAGRYFEIIESTYSIGVDFTDAAGRVSDSIRGALSGLFIEDAYSHFSVSNGATAQTITLLLMETGRGGSRRQPGVVQIVDTGKARTVAGLQFFTTGTAPAVAAQFARAGIANPAASTKRAIIERFSFSTSGAAASIFLGFTTTAAVPTLDAVLRNKKINGPVPVQIQRGFDSNVSASGGMTTTHQFLGVTSGFIEPKYPIVLPNGFAFLAYHQTANQDLSFNVDFSEEDNT